VANLLETRAKIFGKILLKAFFTVDAEISES
jgi:hypothetical protein